MDIRSKGAPVVEGSSSSFELVQLKLCAASGQLGQPGDSCFGCRARFRLSESLSRGDGVLSCCCSGRGAGVTGAVPGVGTGLPGLAVGSTGPVEDAP